MSTKYCNTDSFDSQSQNQQEFIIFPAIEKKLNKTHVLVADLAYKCEQRSSI